MCEHRERDDDFTYSCAHPDYIDRDDIVAWESNVLSEELGIKQVSPGLPLPGCSALTKIGPCPGWQLCQTRWQAKRDLHDRLEAML